MIYSNDFIKFELIENKTIILITVLKDIPTQEEYTNFITQIDNIYEAFNNNKTNFSLLCDLTELGIIPMQYITELKDCFITKRDIINNYQNSTSIITTGVFVKTILNGFLTIYTTIKPVKFVNTMDEALEFIKSVKPGERTLLN